MKPCPKMQRIIEQLAQKHGIDLVKFEAHFRLDMEGFDRLVVENIGQQRIVVAHYFVQNGDLVPDPAIVFFVGQASGWIPLGITQAIIGPQTYVRMSLDGQLVLEYDRKRQADLAGFVETWAQNLIDQGWLEEGRKDEDPLQQLLAARGAVPLFPLGQIVATPGGLEALEQAEQTPHEFLIRHVCGDWGMVDEPDRQANERALVEGTRLVSVYETARHVRLWVITEWDRSVTTLLLPSEY